MRMRRRLGRNAVAAADPSVVARGERSNFGYLVRQYLLGNMRLQF